MRICSKSMNMRLALAFVALVLSACGGGGEASDVSASSSPQVINQDLNPSAPVTEAAAVRFLEQASFGPTTESIARVRQLGFDAYIDEQFSLPASAYVRPLDSDIGMTVLQQRFFSNAINGRDQLRQRMAFALGQIFVVSHRGVNNKDAIMSYQRMLLASALDNYYDILRKVTLHPTMGVYLNMANNWAGDSPNENYAREVMQLFSIGPVSLNLDGSEQMDRFGNPAESYRQDDVEQLARALTGWTFPTLPGETPRTRNPWNFYGVMEPRESKHDNGAKTLLGVTLPAGQNAEQDLSGALNAIFMHPNVAPFICFRLIQRFVTSNPSPAYVARVSRTFNDNGEGTRGDMRAVIKSILLDPEARRGDDPSQALPYDGKLKEPVLVITGLLRSLDARVTGKRLNDHATAMGQNVFGAPSVFSYYPPDYALHGTALYGPEFKIRTGPNIIATANFINTAIHGHAPDAVTVNLAKWTALASDARQLLDAIDLRLMHGSMSDAMRFTLIAAIEALPPESALVRTQTALYLAATSSQYAVQH